MKFIRSPQGVRKLRNPLHLFDQVIEIAKEAEHLETPNSIRASALWESA
jgi:hypothetical protein